MNRDDIIRMAREAGFNEIQTNAMVFGAILERFAALVAAAEREAMIEQGWRQCAKGQRTTQFCGLVELVVLAEREACAKVCEENADDDTEGDWDSACISCANHIRARGQA